jgi:uncharacterized coiled-coil protein SlyX
MWKSLVNLMLSGALLGMSMCGTAEDVTPPNSASKSMEWQMMPGESLDSLSRLFYPKNSAMQRLFVKSSLKLNREQMPELTGSYKFEDMTTLQIPTLIELSRHAPKKPRRKPQPVAAIPDAEAGLAAFEPEKQAPTALGKEQSSTVQALEQRVEQRQKELDKLNERLKSLQQESQALQDSIKANNQPIEEAKGRQLKRVE